MKTVFNKTSLAIALSSVLMFACSNENNHDNAVSEKAKSETTQTANKKNAEQDNMVDQNAAFDEFKKNMLEEMWEVYPTYGLYVGYYKNDHILNVPNDQRDAQEAAFSAKISEQLAAFDIEKLSPGNASDLALIKNQIESGDWYRNVFKSGEWNPASYNVAGAFGLILNTDYKPLEDRLKTILKRLENIPAYYDAAKANIVNPTLEHTDLAIQQNKGALGIFEKRLPESVASSKLSDEEKAAFDPKVSAAVNAIKGYVEWLEKKREVLADGNAKDFRIGAELYEQKFKYDIVSGYTAKELFDKAVEAKQNLHQEMIAITEKLWPKYFKEQAIPEDRLMAVKQMIDHLSVKHIEREKFVDEVRRQMPIIEKFIVEKDLLEMDPTRPLVIRETPEYMRGIAGASVSAPGPYDATANTYYNVTPLEHYTEEQAESYLREYNHWILQILNIHEALPGHYTQLVHANKSPSKIKSIFGNGAMIEGWAVYSERMMLEEGYGNNEPEMWLMYSKWNLRVVVNTILDYSIQVLGMSKEEGLSLLMNEAFQERTEAEGKWRRATLSQVQLTSYFNGYAEIYAFREELKKKLGDKFILRDFHNQFLSYGNAPVPVIRDLMLKDLGLN